jgi:hypothetical protein
MAASKWTLDAIVIICVVGGFILMGLFWYLLYTRVVSLQSVENADQLKAEISGIFKISTRNPVIALFCVALLAGSLLPSLIFIFGNPHHLKVWARIEQPPPPHRVSVLVTRQRGLNSPDSEGTLDEKFDPESAPLRISFSAPGYQQMSLTVSEDELRAGEFRRKYLKLRPKEPAREINP